MASQSCQLPKLNETRGFAAARSSSDQHPAVATASPFRELTGVMSNVQLSSCHGNPVAGGFFFSYFAPRVSSFTIPYHIRALHWPTQYAL